VTDDTGAVPECDRCDGGHPDAGPCDEWLARVADLDGTTLAERDGTLYAVEAERVDP